MANEKMVYTIPTDSEYWGNDVTPEVALASANKLLELMQEEYPLVEFRLVPERQSYRNRPMGDDALIEELKLAEERLWLDFID